MTRQRIYGSDVPFMAWVRRCDRLPSHSIDCGVVMTDVDCFVHRYLTSVDRQGTRDLQAMIEIEVKTRGGKLMPSQQDTYRKKHLSIRKTTRIDGHTVFNYGVAILRMTGTDPENSDRMAWGRYVGMDGVLEWRRINVEKLIGIMRFELNPDTLKPISFRRHHVNRSYRITEETPLGFMVDRKIVHRS